MNSFYIDKLIVSGGDHKPSVIEFKPGLNFILGPSNTGKTLLMDCLDYMFGFQPKNNRPSKIVDNNNGYEKITLYLITNNGSVILERKIGDTKISISGTDPTVEHGNYSIGHTAKKNINSVFLHLIGIDEAHSIRSAEKGSKTQDLTWRSMLHLFFLKQADVARESSALLAPYSKGPTSSASVLLFLLTGQDANSLAKEEDPKITEAKRKALISYIQRKADEYEARRIELEEKVAAMSISDSQSGIDNLRKKISDLKAKMDSATKESNSIMSEIYKWNGKLSESQTMEHNFSILYRQYQSDIRRIGFVIDGASNLSSPHDKVICPICGEETEHLHDTSFINASTIELEKIKTHLSELRDAQQSLKQQQEDILARIDELEARKDEINKLITEQLQPQLSVFEENLERQLMAVKLTSELDVVRDNETQYRTELFYKTTESTAKQTKYKVNEDYEYEIVHGFEEKLREILKASKIGGGSTAKLNMDIFDIEIDGKKKSVSMGGGYCGILNTITTLAMSAYLIDRDRNAPRFFAVDSSLTQLSETVYKEQSETIKQNFIEYLVKHSNERQIIIIEQADRMPFVPSEDESVGVHVISFTGKKNNGRYGFLNDVYNKETI